MPAATSSPAAAAAIAVAASARSGGGRGGLLGRLLGVGGGGGEEEDAALAASLALNTGDPAAAIAENPADLEAAKGEGAAPLEAAPPCASWGLRSLTVCNCMLFACTPAELLPPSDGETMNLMADTMEEASRAQQGSSSGRGKGGTAGSSDTAAQPPPLSFINFNTASTYDGELGFFIALGE
jgi:hypothetical protein